MPGNERSHPGPNVTFLVLTLATAERLAFVRANRRVLPELQSFRAVNGFDRDETVRALAASHLKYHIYSYCGFSRFGTFGSLANFLTKHRALLHQVEQRMPYMAMLEDDLQLTHIFKPFVQAQVREHLAPGLSRRLASELLVLGTWGEGYVTSLASARRILSRLAQQGIPMNVDIMLNDGHVGQPYHVHSTPWSHRRAPNAGDCLKTPHVKRGDIPRELLQLPRRCGSPIACRAIVEVARKRYCRGVNSSVREAKAAAARAEREAKVAEVLEKVREMKREEEWRQERENWT